MYIVFPREEGPWLELGRSLSWQTDSVVFVADDLGAWLVGLLADAGRKRLLAFVFGDDQQRALRSAAAAAVQGAADELFPADAGRAEELAMVTRQVFGDAVPAPPAGYGTVLEALQAGVAAQLSVLDDVDLTGTGQSAADVIGVPGKTVAEKLTECLLREITVRAASGGPLAPLAAQLNHDRTYLGLETLKGTIAVLGVGPAGQVASQRAVVGDIPHEPPAHQLRDDLLAELEVRAAVGSISVVCALTGLRGAGKTHVAAAYARARIAEGWRLVAWIHADDQSAIVTGLTAVAAAMGLERTGLDGAGIGQAVRHRLEADGARCLVVFDNADDPDNLLPFLPAAGDARVLITSTRQSMGHLGRRVQVGEFTIEQALTFLAARTGRPDTDAARMLSEELGCLPLALAQASAVIEAQHLDYGTYLGRLRATPVEKMLGPVEASQYPHGVAGAILLSLENAKMGDETGLCASIMDLASVLSPAGVSRSLLYAAGQCRRLRDTHLAAPEEIDRALGRLAGHSLLTFTGNGQRVGAHRLVTRVARERLTQNGSLAAVSADAAKALDTLCAPVLEACQDREQARDLIQQIQALHEHSACARSADGGDLTGKLLELRMWALTLMDNLGDSAAAAVAAGEPLLAEAEQVLGSKHPRTLNTGDNLATAYRAAGRISQAIALQETVVRTSSEVLGSEHHDTLGYLGNLANAYQDGGRTSDAITVHQQVLASREHVLGSDHPETLTTRANLAASYQVAGWTRQAITLNERVLADRERLLGPDHPDNIASLNNLANAYHEAGRISAALPLYERVLVGHEQILGPAHPATLTARINLANAIMDAGHPDQALAQCQQTLVACEQALGSSHPLTFAAQASLANIYTVTGQLSDAIELYEQALASHEQVLGPQHPRTLTCRGNLAVAYRRARFHEQAIRLLERTAADQQRILGPDHPDTLNSLSNLANAYQASGQHARALPLYENVLADRKQILSAGHPSTLISQGNLANIYAQVGRLSDAIALYESTLADCERILGADHPTTREIRYNYENAERWQLPGS